MDIRGQHLTVRLSGDNAAVTVTYKLVLLQQDLALPGGYNEWVGLEPAPHPVGTHTIRRFLSLDDAIEPRPGDGYKELYREHTFRVPRHPKGPFTTVRFNGRIEITPAMERGAEEVTGEGVLPAQFTLGSAIRSVPKRIRDLVERVGFTK